MRFFIGWIVGFACGGAATIATAIFFSAQDAPGGAISTASPTIMDGSKVADPLMSSLFQTIGAGLHDPYSAQIIELHIGADERVCGKMNAKNKMGGYTGFRHFAFDGATGKIAHLPDTSLIDITSPDAKRQLDEARSDIDFLRISCPMFK